MIVLEEERSLGADMKQEPLLVLPVKVKFPMLNLCKEFIYYVKSDIQYNIDAFLLSTGLRIDC